VEARRHPGDPAAGSTCLDRRARPGDAVGHARCSPYQLDSPGRASSRCGLAFPARVRAESQTARERPVAARTSAGVVASRFEIQLGARVEHAVGGASGRGGPFPDRLAAAKCHLTSPPNARESSPLLCQPNRRRAVCQLEPDPRRNPGRLSGPACAAGCWMPMRIRGRARRAARGGPAGAGGVRGLTGNVLGRGGPAAPSEIPLPPLPRGPAARPASTAPVAFSSSSGGAGGYPSQGALPRTPTG